MNTNRPVEIAPRVLSWASELDPNTREQAARTARLPIIHGHVALMPDAHLGKGATVGVTASQLPDSLDAVLDRAIEVVASALGRSVTPTEVVNVHHNYAAREPHGDRELWITRKGATSAKAGAFGIIPGSMATGSYIVRGRGNPASFQSCSRGAGRRLSRSQARKTLTPESLVARMRGKTWQQREARELVDEHPDAYKDLAGVMADQADLVEPVHRLTAVLNYKGIR